TRFSRDWSSDVCSSDLATFGNYQSALLDLMKAQTRAADAQERVSTQKNATDLTGFGRQSETLTALKGAQSRIQGFIDTSDAVVRSEERRVGKEWRSRGT